MKFFQFIKYKQNLIILFLVYTISNPTSLLSNVLESDYYFEHAEEISITRSGDYKRNRKQWTFIVYMAADNDLRSFAMYNIKQMVSIGSNEHINIVIHLDIRLNNNIKVTRRYYIEKGKIIHVNANDPNSQQMDSGNAQTLVSCCRWAIENYPAENYSLILWNHGTGILDPARGKIINPAELFTFNPLLKKFELDRSIGFFDFIDMLDNEQRGICWDNTTGNYLTNQKLDQALYEICSKDLNGKKFSIIGFDACLMSMLEITNIIKKYAHFMVSSQEVELGTGWDYALVLTPFTNGSLDPHLFVKHIVAMFEKAYTPITNDFTQSALNLANIQDLENNIHAIAELLLTCLQKQKNNTVKNAIKASRNKLLCTHFDEPAYIDLHHFYSNLQLNIRYFSLTHEYEEQEFKRKLINLLEQGKVLIKQLVVANAAGSNLKNAQGISIYFPERKMHASYLQAPFAQTNYWAQFITSFIAL
jgi:hypothetical protein